MKTKLFFILLISLLLSFTQSVKADTIHYQLPGNAQLCQNSLAMDTFVFHKPMGFGSTVWYVDFILVGSGDSLIYIPTISGDHVISSTWNSNAEQFMLSIYSTPPPHATFSVSSGGSINATKDTVWKCGTSVSFRASNISGSDAVYDGWTGPDGFSSNNNPITVTIPGIYYFDRANPCGSTRDSVLVVQTPTTVPVWADTTFCNATISLTLDPGPGWSYSWNTGAHTQTIEVSEVGFYKVITTNACKTDSASIHVGYEAFPLPDLSMYLGTPLCHTASLVLNPNPEYSYDSYLWNTGATTPTLTVSGSSAMYMVTVSKGVCLSQAAVLVQFHELLAAPSICIATVDYVTGKNKVVFQPTITLFDVVASYNIYKLTSDYTLIGTVAASSNTITFIDNTSNPMASATRYKISAVDTCGDESLLSYGHGTIKITSTQGTGGVLDLTVTDSYWDESGAFAPSKYYILIDSLNDGNLAIMDSLNAIFNSYTVGQPVVGATYLIGIAFPWACGDGTKNITQEMSISNKSLVVPQGIASYYQSLPVTIYPIPSSSGIFQIQTNLSMIDITITDLSGRVLTIIKSSSTIDLSEFSNGVYNAIIKTTQGSTSKSLMIAR